MNHHNHDIDIVIFHGDDTSFPGNGQIAITIDTELDLTGMSAHFQLCNFVQTFPVIPEDKTLLINVPASYTEKFPVGCTFAKVWLLDATGLKRTLANTLSVLVTNRVDLAYATDTTQSVKVSVKGVVTWESIQGKPNVVLSVNGTEPDENGNVEVEAGLPECTIQDIPEEFTEDEMRLKVNEIISWCKGGTAIIAAILSLTALGEPTVNLTVETAQKGKILNTANIVTDVSATLSGMEDLASVETVSNIVEGYGFATQSITNGLRGYDDLSYNTNFVTVVREATGDEPWTLVYGSVITNLVWKTPTQWGTPDPPNPQAGDKKYDIDYFDSSTPGEFEIYLKDGTYIGDDWDYYLAGTARGPQPFNLVTSLNFSDGVATATRIPEGAIIGATTNTVTNVIALASQVASVSQSVESVQSRTNDWNAAAGWATTNYLPISGGTVTGAVTIVRREAYEGSAKTIFTIADQGFNYGVCPAQVSFKPFENFASFFTGMQFTGLLRGSLHIPSWNDFGVESYDESTDAPYLQTVPMLIAPISTALVNVSNDTAVAYDAADAASRQATDALGVANATSAALLNVSNTANTANANALIADTKAQYALEALQGKQDTLPYLTNAIPYSALTGTPTIPTVPTQVSAFANDAGYVNALTVTNIAESAVASADTTYRLTVGVTNLNQSVQYVALDDTTTELAISLPTGDGAKDWLVYVNAATNTTLILPAATWWMSDEAFTNAIPAGLTALYFSQISTNGVYSLGRQEMTPITIAP